MGLNVRDNRIRPLLALTVAATAATGALLAGSAQAQTPAVPPSVTAEAERVTSQDLYRHATWTWSFVDQDTGERLYERSPETMIEPGSLNKNYSSSTVLRTLGPNYRFRTPVHRIGSVSGSTLKGNLVLVGKGDYSFGLREKGSEFLWTNVDHSEAGKVPGAELVDGDPLAGVNGLARAVRGTGIRRVDGDVVVDDRMFTPYDEWDDGLLTPILVNENFIDIVVKPGARSGAAASVRWRPGTAAYRIANRVRTSARGGSGSISVEQTGPRTVTVSGTIPAGARDVLNAFEVPDPAAFARTAFIEALRRAGVTVTASTVGENPRNLLPRSRSYPASTKLGEHVSGPLSEFVKVIMKTSYNRSADLMVCLTAVASGSRSCPAGLRTVERSIRSFGANPGASTFVFDGAGSNDVTRTTARDMTTLMRSVSRSSFATPFKNTLPILGVDGSLVTVLPDSPAKGKIFAKTGTRARTTPTGRIVGLAKALSGYIETGSGRRIVFSVFQSGTAVTSIDDIIAQSQDVARIPAAVQQAY